MESEFVNAIDAAVEQALPAAWPRVPRERLPARGSAQTRHAFRKQHGSGAESYLAVVAASPPDPADPPNLPHAPHPPHPPISVEVLGPELIAVVDEVMCRGACVLLLYEDGRGALGGWIEDRIACPHPRLLALGCGRDGDDAWTVAPTVGEVVALADTIGDLWSGRLLYDGPEDGLQTVGVEIMKDECRRCHVHLDTVTGIVFPDRQVADWSLPDWTYFQGLLALAEQPHPLIDALAAAVDAWRAAGEVGLTPIRRRFSLTASRWHWAAECPACHAFRGAMPVLEERVARLANPDVRRMELLRYRPLGVDITRHALRALAMGFESSRHVRPIRWYRPSSPDRADREGPRGAYQAVADLAAGVLAEPGPERLDDGASAARREPLVKPAPEVARPGLFTRLGQILATLGGPRR